MAAHRFITRKVDENSALQLLIRKSFFGNKIPVKAEKFFLPGYIYQVKVMANKSITLSEEILVDAISGEFSFIENIEFDEKHDDLNSSLWHLNFKEAKAIATTNYGQFLTARNLKTKVGAQIKSISLVSSVYYPIWVGYFSNKKQYYYRILDAVSGKLLGSRLNSSVSKLILAS